MSSLGLTIPLTVVSSLGLLVNGYILIVVILTRQVGSANNLLLLHLGALNTLLGLLFLAFTTPGVSKNGWLAQGVPCAIHGFLFTVLHPMVLWTICGLNCDRYYAIAAPLHYGHLVSVRKVIIGLGAGWLVALALSFPPLFAVAPYTYSAAFGSCVPDFSTGSGTLWYSAIYTAFTLLLPATLIICCNLKILMIARYHRHRIASAIYEVTLSAQVTITHQRNPFFVPTVTAPSAGGPKFRGKSAITTVFQLLASFLILYVPYYSVILWDAALSYLRATGRGVAVAVPSKIDHYVFALSTVLLTCSALVNGFLYGLKSKTLRKTFQNYWRKKLTKSEVNQEIQARTPSTCGSRRPSLTPLGFFTKPTISRRLSEALLDVHRAVGSPTRLGGSKKPPGELAWRPTSTPGLNLSPTEKAYKKMLPHTASCNTLQLPRSDLDEICAFTEDDSSPPGSSSNGDDVKHPRRRYDEYIRSRSTVGSGGTLGSSANAFLHRMFGLHDADSGLKAAAALRAALQNGGTPKRSPRILITRAFSEESDKTGPSAPGTPPKRGSDLVTKKRISSSSSTLIERKWTNLTNSSANNKKTFNVEEDVDDDDSDDERVPSNSRPLLSPADRDSCNASCNSSVASSSSSSCPEEEDECRTYAALESASSHGGTAGGLSGETGSECSTAEDQLLLSWPERRTSSAASSTYAKERGEASPASSSARRREIAL